LDESVLRIGVSTRLNLRRADLPLFAEEVEEDWADLEQNAIPSDRLDAIWDYIIATGQASA
jgi:hypothetical protein